MFNTTRKNDSLYKVNELDYLMDISFFNTYFVYLFDVSHLNW